MLPIVLSSRTPSELLSYIISYHRYPTTLLIGSSKEEFLHSLTEDVKGHIETPSVEDAFNNKITTHPLLQATLLQTAISRHIRTVFIPTVTHLRAYTSIFTPDDSKITAPPSTTPQTTTPLLLVYGFLELHRDASEWSAQGIGSSLAALVDGAARNGFRAVVVELKGIGGLEAEKGVKQEIPLLNGTSMREDGTWAGPTVPVSRVLSRWFEFEHGEDAKSEIKA